MERNTLIAILAGGGLGAYLLLRRGAQPASEGSGAGYSYVPPTDAQVSAANELALAGLQAEAQARSEGIAAQAQVMLAQIAAQTARNQTADQAGYAAGQTLVAGRAVELSGATDQYRAETERAGLGSALTAKLAELQASIQQAIIGADTRRFEVATGANVANYGTWANLEAERTRAGTAIRTAQLEAETAQAGQRAGTQQAWIEAWAKLRAAALEAMGRMPLVVAPAGSAPAPVQVPKPAGRAPNPIGSPGFGGWVP